MQHIQMIWNMRVGDQEAYIRVWADNIQLRNCKIGKVKLK